MIGIPTAIATDVEDVAWGLQTADALWKRGERIDAVVWLRRAAQAAGAANDDARALELGRVAAELSDLLDTAATGPHTEIPRGTIPDGGLVPPMAMQAPAAPIVEPQRGLPLDEVAPHALGEGEIRPSVLPAEQVHAGMYDPWDEKAPPRSDEGPPPAPPAASARPPAPSAADGTPSAGRSPSMASVAPEPPRPATAPPPSQVASGAVAFSSTSSGDDTDDVLTSVRPDSVPAAPAAPRMTPSSPDLPGSPPRGPGKPPPLPPRARGAKPPTPPPRPSEADVETSAPRAPVADVVLPPAPAQPAADALPEVDVELEPIEVEVMTAAPEAPSAETAPAEVAPAEVAPAPPAGERLDLDDVEAFADLPDEARAAFAAAATVHRLAEGEEISHFALAYVLEGELDVAATIVDASAMRLARGEVLRSRGTTNEAVPMRLVATAGGGVVATWSDAAVDEAFRTCPWVEDDLRSAADRMLTLVGITIGPLGERLDASIREQIVGRLTMRTIAPGEIVVNAGETVPGLLLVGIGELELVKGEGIAGVVGSGEFLFATEVLGAGSAPLSARAGAGGALVLFGDRHIAQELLVTCPPLLEVFAGM